MISDNLKKHTDLLIRRYPSLGKCRQEIEEAFEVFATAYSAGNKLLIGGNGGSAGDAEHIVGELMKSFKYRRKPSEEFIAKLEEIDKSRAGKLAAELQGALPAIALDSHVCLTSAHLNDMDGVTGYAQQLYGYGRQGDVFLGISTSGNSKNVMYAAVTAKAKGMEIVALTGADGGELAQIADVAVRVPETETYMIQEYHLPIYHCWCLMLEERFFG